MIVVIQCAARKKPDAGHLQGPDGRNIMFVANPATAPVRTDRVYARPDDPADAEKSWRTLLLDYNTDSGNNPLGLLHAWKLYANPTYERLAKHVGVAHLYILSAGWGLIKADFLTPAYDITFTSQADDYKRRRKSARYNDFCMLPSEGVEPIVFFGGKDYVNLFCSLTKHAKGHRTVWHNSASEPKAEGCCVQRFNTAIRTNWHYECAQAFIEEKLVF